MTIRVRLTLLYTGLFFIASTLLLGGTYRLVEHALSFDDLQWRLDRQQELNPDGVQFRVIETQLQERQQALKEIRKQAWRALIVVTIGAALLGGFVAKRVLRPIRKIADHARRASSANLGERLDLRGPPDELHDLATTFDAMLDRLHVAFETQRLFAGEVSHELRTPLTIMRAAADVSLANPEAAPSERELSDTVRTSVTRSERLIDSLLILARSESTLLDRAPIDLANIAGECLANAAREAGEAGVTIAEAELNPVIIWGDRVLLERLCDNLIDNAIRYNLHDGNGWLRVTVTSDAERGLVTVVNTGPVLAPGRVDRLFAPFQRGTGEETGEESGSGLGLAIVRSVTSAHGGAIEAVASHEGGLSITVTFPATHA